ncbi:hypothetical protein BD779DRAFT_1676236 [Infundibulicybe gibba]|nr:hypothetical protein BD779DRAFT_1676236 [Infundibulicybe gibba]
MKFAILALGLVLAVHDTQAQTSNTPSCALGCITTAAQAANCSISDITCLCGSSFRSATERCVSQGVCEPNDQSTLDSVLSALCNGVTSTSGAGSGPSTGNGPASSTIPTAGTTVTIHVSNTPKPPITTGSLTIISSLIPPAPSTADTTSAASPSESTLDSAAPAPTFTSTSALAPTSALTSVPAVTLPTPATTLTGPSTSVVFSTVASDGLPTPATSQPAGSSANRLGIPSGVALCVILSMLLVHNY